MLVGVQPTIAEKRPLQPALPGRRRRMRQGFPSECSGNHTEEAVHDGTERGPNQPAAFQRPVTFRTVSVRPLKALT
jgi:hypothetical protein